MDFYNEFDSHAAQWLQNLISEGLISDGKVDSRSITEIKATDLEGFDRCHFFSGIAGWDYALKLAGWPADNYGLTVWTGSCPCQPFSVAGARKGTADERHLWPEFYRLIGECRPDIVFGEQVASADGRQWLAGVHTDLENLGYTFGAIDTCAASLAAPHIRQRLYWVALSRQQRSRRSVHRPGESSSANSERPPGESGGSSGPNRLDNPAEPRFPGDERSITTRASRNETRLQESERRIRTQGMGEPIRARLEGHPGHGDRSNEPGRLFTSEDRSASEAGSVGRLDDSVSDRRRTGRNRNHEGDERFVAGSTIRNDFWSNYDTVPCADGKARRVESGLSPLVARISKGMVYSSDPSAPTNENDTSEARAMRLKGYGNSLTIPVAVAFIQIVMEYLNGEVPI